jgi:hypothetical protein
MEVRMWRFLVLCVVLGCGRPNPEFCCVTEAQCAAAGLEELRPCDLGQACSSTNVCVEKECDTSADCTLSEAPTCTNGLCVAGCSIDDDCIGVPGAPHCDGGDGACVGCVSSDQCQTSAAICDPEIRTCRGCERDDECASGVCIEADGTCADEATVVYVSEVGGADVGTCTKDAPCRTMGFASNQLVSSRRVLHIIGGAFNLGAGIFTLADAMVIDGTNTVLTTSASPIFRALGPAIVEGVVLQTTSRVVEVPAGGVLRLFGVDTIGGELQTDGGALSIERSNLTNATVSCLNADLTIKRTQADGTAIITSNCPTLISRSRLSSGTNQSLVEMLSTDLGVITIENSVFEENRDAGTPIRFSQAAPASQFRFNTIVRSSPVQTAAKAISCLSAVSMTSNIFAFNSTFPMNNLCMVERSLFDLPGASTAMSGSGNVSGDVGTFFRDRENGDFHLDPNSPARLLGVPGLVTEDFDGVLRPVPEGSDPDSGAFETP